MSNAIRIDDLREPRLSPAQQAVIDATAGLQVELSVDEVLCAARERTGLADLERLGLLVDEWGSDAAMRPLQRLNLRNYLVRYAANRLLLQDLWKRHPEILETEIRQPIIVAGLPRSGTTHLVNLLAADRRFHSLPLWESYEPVALPGEPALPDGTADVARALWHCRASPCCPTARTRATVAAPRPGPACRPRCRCWRRCTR